MNGTEKNNKVFIKGEIVSEATFSHEVYGEGFYELYVKVMRLSGQADILPVTVSERLISEQDLKIGSTLCAMGQFRSYNKIENGKSRLMLTVFVREPVDVPPSKNPNSIVLSGYIPEAEGGRGHKILSGQAGGRQPVPVKAERFPVRVEEMCIRDSARRV